MSPVEKMQIVAGAIFGAVCALVLVLALQTWDPFSLMPEPDLVINMGGSQVSCYKTAVEE